MSVSFRNIYLSKAWRASCFSFVCSAWSDVSLDCCKQKQKQMWKQAKIKWKLVPVTKRVMTIRGKVEIYRLNAQLHSLSVQFDGFIIISLLVFLKSLGDQEVGTLKVHLLPGFQWVALLGLDWGQRSREAIVRTHNRHFVNRAFVVSGWVAKQVNHKSRCETLPALTANIPLSISVVITLMLTALQQPTEKHFLWGQFSCKISKEVLLNIHVWFLEII